jgi:hypothetical protein
LKLETPFRSDSLDVSAIDVVSFPEGALLNAQQNPFPLKVLAVRKAALNFADLLRLRSVE